MSKIPIEPRLPESAKVIEIIETAAVIGTGVHPNNPVRRVIQYWSLDGKLLFTRDECAQFRELHPLENSR